MNRVFGALVGLALFAPVPAEATAKAPASKATTAKKAPARSAAPKARAKAPAPQERARSAAAARVIDWVASSQDNRALPYVVIDKNSAVAFLFDAKGTYIADAPVLIGIALGDDATPGIGSKNLAEIGPAEKTTPAGRFLAKFGLAAGRQKVLWVDYTTSVALHPIPTGNPKEKRRDRMLSATPDDNRITFGCINVPLAFYNKAVSPLFQKKGGYVYILPDTKSLEAAFPPLHAFPGRAFADTALQDATAPTEPTL